MKNSSSSSKAPYLERDISWLYFNARLLQEMQCADVPLLERLNFAGIYSNNLDEFFRVRVAANSRVAQLTGRHDSTEAAKARRVVKDIKKIDAEKAEQYTRGVQALMDDLKKENVIFVSEKELTDEQAHYARCYFRSKVNGFISPVWLSEIKDFFNDKDDHIYLALSLTGADGKVDYAVVCLPSDKVGRFVLLPERNGNKYIMYLDDMVRLCLPMVFPEMGFTGFEAYSFKFTKDAEMTLDNDGLSAGLAQKVAKAVRNRRKGPAMRIIYDAAMPEVLLYKLMRKLKIDKLDTLQPSGRYHNHKDFLSFPQICRSDLRYQPMAPVIKPEIKGDVSIIRLIERKDRYIHVPYHSFDYFIRLLQEAAVSSLVRSIKITLYRVANPSKVVAALICAARNGKKVMAMVELLARFDEKLNIDYARKLMEGGVNVVTGPEGLKVHGKMVHIGMRNGKNIGVISTGNFHEGNAKVYTDYLLMTANPILVKEIDDAFAFIRKPYSRPRFRELIVSPCGMREAFYALIDNEIANARASLPAWIMIKINHITDPGMVDKLYEAARAGVRIRMLVRGNCSLVLDRSDPLIEKNMEIYGIIDRYLEHSRIFIFCAGGRELTYMGSADWMPRNLDRRVEVITPIYDSEIKADLREVVESGLRDNVKARIVDGSGCNRYNTAGRPEMWRSQYKLYDHYRDMAIE